MRRLGVLGETWGALGLGLGGFVSVMCQICLAHTSYQPRNVVVRENMF